MESHFKPLDWVVLIGYFAGTMAIGAYFYRRTRSTEQFTAAGRSLPGWVCGLSIFATFLSSISYLALPGKSFADNWNPFAFSLALPIATWIGVTWFVTYYRRSGEVSAYALLEKRFGTWARVYASLFYLLTQIARMGVVMYLMALPMAVIFGWDIRLVIVLTGVCVTIYSFIGGVVAVIWTDAFQSIVLMAGAVICLTVLIFGVDGGPREVFSTAWDRGKFSMGPFDASLSQMTFWVVLVNGLFMNLQNFGIDQSYIQRYIASSSTEEARRGLWLGGLLYVPVSALFFLIGTALFVYYQSHSGEIPEVKQLVARQRIMQADGFAHLSPADYQQKLQETAGKITSSEIGDRVFPHFIAKHLPQGLTGLLIAAIFAAAMSTVSTSLNSSATLLLGDYYRRFFRPAASEAESMRVLYAATILWGILGTGMALALVPRTESALDTWWTLASLFSGGMVGLFLLGMISKRAGNAAAISAVATGTLVLAWMAFSPTYWGRVDMNVQLAPDSLIEFRTRTDLDRILTPGEVVFLHYHWIDTSRDARKSAVVRREVKDVAANRLTLTSSLEHVPAGKIILYRDNAWYRWRSPFNNLLAIVFGSLTILVVGIALQFVLDRTRSNPEK